MNSTGLDPIIDELRDHWVRWTKLVERLARRRSDRDPALARAYQDVHQNVVQQCRRLAALADGEEKAYFQSLERLVAPWVSTTSFQRAHQEIRGDLVDRCHQVERALGSRRYILRSLAHLARPARSVAAAACVLWVLWTAGPDWWRPWARRWYRSETATVLEQKTRYARLLVIPGIMAVTASGWLVSRAARP